jgi:hypothetical protein
LDTLQKDLSMHITHDEEFRKKIQKDMEKLNAISDEYKRQLFEERRESQEQKENYQV